MSFEIILLILLAALLHASRNAVIKGGSNTVSYTHLDVYKRQKKHGAEVAAVGNGTAGRETEAFIRALPGWSCLLYTSRCV